MRLIIPAALSCLLCATLFGAPALNILTTEALFSSASSALIAVDVPEPTLSILDRGENGDAVYVEISGALPDFDQTGIVLPTITKLIAVPAGHRAVARLKSANLREFSVDAMIPRDRMERVLRPVEEPSAVEVGEAGWMRWMRVAPVIIRPARYDAATNTIQVAESMELEFDFVPDGSSMNAGADKEKYYSLDFADFFREMVLNPNEMPNILPGGRVVTRGTYLVITDSVLVQYTTQFADWKRAKGFNVVVAPIAHGAESAESIRDYIVNAYLNWDRPPEYVLLLGDVHIIPPFQIRNPFPGINEIDATDLNFGLVNGDDYFPDILIGRVSSDSPSPAIAQNYFARLIRHEKDALNFPPDAFNRAVVFAGNRGDGNSVVLSPVETSEWLAERLREKGYEVYTQMWRKVGDNDDPGTIVEAINRGVNIVSYRGWADAHGTHYPRFYTEDLDRLNNGPLLPVFTFFVCNTGDYDNENRQLCFGEYAISRGGRQNPTGAIDFYGPSDLHTKTTFNNSMLAGYYQGLLYQNLRVFSLLTLRSKMEVWRTNPHLRVQGGDQNFVEFYFSVYNNLGDPETTVYFRRPGRLAVTAPQAMAVGETRAQFVVRDESGNPIKGALVTLLKGNETNLSIMTDHTGTALAPVNLDTPDTLRVMVQAHQFAPAQLKIPVSANARLVGFDGVVVRDEQGGQRLTAGSPVDLTITLRNFGTSFVNTVSATLSSPLEGVEILQAESNFGDIAVGSATASEAMFRIHVSAAINHNANIPLVLAIHDSQGDHPAALFRLVVSNGMIAYRGHQFESEFLSPGSTENLVISIENWSVLPIEGLRASLNCFDNSLEIIDNETTFGDVAAGASTTSANDPFRVTLRAGTAIGREIPLRVHLFDGEGTLLDILFFNIVAGDPGPTDPVGPDGYGYFAYDDVDQAYGEHPTYEWVELDPAFGGSNGTEHIVDDDSTFSLQLPFTFKFYGVEYEQIAVCSNGWASFEHTEAWDFNNWPILSPLGPHSMICPLWEDLVGRRSGATRENMKIYHSYDEANHRFIVEWSRSVARSGGDVDYTETFEVILFDPAFRNTPTGDGEILFQYEEVHVVDRGNVPFDYSTIGIQDWNHSQGIGLTFANISHPSAAEFTSGRAILFTTNPPDNFLGSKSFESVVPQDFVLGEAFPNPFNARTSVEFAIPRSGELKAGIYDLNGRFLLNVGAGNYKAGSHRLEFDAANLPTGMYLLRVEIAGYSCQRKLTLLK